MRCLWIVFCVWPLAAAYQAPDGLMEVVAQQASTQSGVADSVYMKEEQAWDFVQSLEARHNPICLKASFASWNYTSNLTDHNKNISLDAGFESSQFSKQIGKEASQFDWKNFQDCDLKRIFKRLTNLGTSALSDDKVKELLKIESDMETTHAKARICPYRSDGKPSPPSECTLLLEPEIKDILKSPNASYEEKEWAWNEFYRASGKPSKESYKRYVELQNEAARLNGFNDASEMWLEPYDYLNMEEIILDIWSKVEPLYKEVHAWIRRRLQQVYGEDKIKDNGPLPMHLLGHIHGQHWLMGNLSIPFPDRPSIDVTENMVKQGYDATRIFKLAEEYFMSLGLPKMPEEFWKYSILEKPKDGRDLVCHASAWDFCGTNLVRIKQCTQVAVTDLIVAHHEMGHIEYFLEYKDLPFYYREGANPGFHEAIGDTLALAVSTPAHYKTIGLLDKVEHTEKDTINYLMSIAMEKIVFLPTGFIFDLWRWNVFRGKYKPDQYQEKWWELLLKYQGVCPSIRREKEDFDPASKYHISASVPYTRYFVSHILQFQFYEAMCDAAGHKGPLHQCDFYNSKEAGKKFKDMLKMGSSKPWPQALRAMTGTGKIDAKAVLRYFKPLYDWLLKENRGKTVGWTSQDPLVCP